jgi:hypothetical protein
MRTHLKLRASERPRKFWRLSTVLAVLVTAVTVSLSVGAVRPSTSGAVTKIWGAYGGGRMMAVDPNGGYWTTSWLGSVTPYGGAPVLGTPAMYGIHLSRPVLGMAATPMGGGYWLVASDGGVFSFGDARFHGSTGSIHLNEPIVGMAATPTGRGYWLVASDGGIFSFGDAGFHGSTGSIHLNQPIVGMASTPDGGGYWLVASDGGIFTFGDAVFYGSTGSIHLNQPIVGMASTPDGGGYWLVASDGGIFTFGDAPFYGSLGSSGKTVLGFVISPSTAGYALVISDGTSTTFTAPPTNNALTVPTTQPIEIGGGSQGADCAPNIQPTATVDSNLDSLFANEAGPGWIGADGTYSTSLPNGQESFVFSDTLIGTAQSSGLTSITGMPRNSELVGTIPSLNTDIRGTYGSPQSLIPDTPGSSDHWWTASTYVENGNQLVYVNEFSPVPGSPFEQFAGRAGIAVLSLSATGMPSYSSITLLPTDPDTQWGNAVMQDASYTYVYGLDSNPSSGTFFGMKVARVALGASLDVGDWTYWNGTQWLSGEANAAPIATGSVVTGVVAQEGGAGYVAVSIPGGVYHDSTVSLSYACSPTGPWSVPKPVYSIPQIAEYQDEIAYIPTFHPDLTGQGGLVVSYNINSTSEVAVLQDVHQYQPQFLLLNN